MLVFKIGTISVNRQREIGDSALSQCDTARSEHQLRILDPLSRHWRRRYIVMRIPNFTAEAALIHVGIHYSTAGSLAKDAELLIVPSQSCNGPYFCGPANSCITMLVATGPDQPAVPVTQCCGWGFYPWIQTCDEQPPRQGCRWVWDPFAHCDHMLPANPPPPPPPDPCEACTNCHKTSIGWCFCDGKNCGWGSHCCP